MKQISRRSFIVSTLAAGAAPSLARGKEVSANEELRIAVIGLGIRGPKLVRQFGNVPGVRVAALCDPDSHVLGKHIEQLSNKTNRVAGHIDARNVIDDSEIEAVAIATPNHWHSLLGIWACQNGKDIYVEKPVSHNLYEGWQLLAAARRYDRIAQTGTQNRSDTGLRQAVDFVHSGKLGQINLVRGFCYNRRPSIGKVTSPQTVPAHINYDLWSGPAQVKPLMRGRFHYDWHWDFTYGNGDVGNQGVHELDICRWMLNVDQLPSSSVSVGGRFGYDDNGDTPNTLITVLGYQPAPIVFEVRGLPARQSSENMDSYRGQRVGVVVECDDGYFAGGRGGGAIFNNDGESVKRLPGDSGTTHVANFIEAVRSRDRSLLRAEIREGVLSSGLSHFCNMSYQVGEAAEPNDIKHRLRSDPIAAELTDGMADHLARNGVDLDRTPAVVGPSLTWNNEKRRFLDNETANELMTREYREPFTVTDVTA